MDARRKRYKRGDLDLQTANADAQNSGVAYQLSLADPRQYPGVRVPDLISLPTVVAPDFLRITVPPCQQATTLEWFTIVQTSSVVNGMYRYVTAISLAGVPTWSAWTVSPNETSYDANMAGQRLVSGGIYVQDASALLGRNGLIYGNCYGGGCDALNANILYLLQDPGATMANVADAEDMDEFLCSWRPSDIEYDLDMSVLGAGIQTTSGSCCMVLIQHFPDSGTPPSLEFEFHANREFIPLPFTRQLFENDMCLGGPEDSSRAQDAIVLKANAKSGSSSNWMTKLRSVADGVAKVGSYVQKGLGLASMVAGLFAVPPRHDLESAHYLAIASRDHSKSPYHFDGPMNKRDVYAMIAALHLNRKVAPRTPCPFASHPLLITAPMIMERCTIEEEKEHSPRDGSPPQSARSSAFSDVSTTRGAVLVRR
jgi:hypothetical protein